MKQRIRPEIRTLSDDDMREELREFEQRYGMTSDEFVARYEAGDIGDSADNEKEADFIIWASTFEYLRRKSGDAS